MTTTTHEPAPSPINDTTTSNKPAESAAAPADLTAQIQQWKATGVLHRVRVTGSSGQIAQGEVYVENWDQKARMTRALKALGMCLGGACVAILIPLVHFILVPALLIAAPIVTWKVYQQDAVVLGGLTTCPKCGSRLPIVRGKVSWPLKDVCGKCYENVKIEEA